VSGRGGGTSAWLGQWLPTISVALAMLIVAGSVVTIPLAAAEQLALPRQQITAWIIAIYGLPSLLGLIFALHYRQPLLLTGNIFVLIFIVSLGDRLTFAELIGASIAAGAVVVLLTMLGLTSLLAEWVPAPVVMGLLAGSVLPFVAGIFTALGLEPVIIGGAFVAYLLGSMFLAPKVPPIFPALVAALTSAALLGRFGHVNKGFAPPIPEFTVPEFTGDALLTATPVIVVLIVLQSNVPSLVFLRSQNYTPPAHMLDYVSGIGTMAGSFLGPIGVSMSLPATALVAGPDAGRPEYRYRSIALVSIVFLLLMLLVGFSADLIDLVPRQLLLGIAGMAVIGVLSLALQHITAGPLKMGPLFAFATALSDISLLGLGPAFWALVIGVLVCHLLERDELKELS
jgi:benzoate membrane transport protein